jgi:voltage-gated potassium channel
MSARRRVCELLEHAGPGDRAAQALDVFLILLITGNVTAVVLESIPEIGQAYRAWFRGFEAFSIAVFTVEYVLRVWSAIEQTYPRYKHPLWGRLRYAASPMAVIDLLAVLPFYLSFLVAIDLRVLRVLRLVRMFKLTRYSPAMNLLLTALREEAQAIAAALFVLLLLFVLASSLAYLAEHEAQPATFGTIPQAMWWAIVTLTTVGYGDVVPVTPWGKVVGGLVGIIGIGMVALPAGLLASGFSEQLHQRRREFEVAVDRILATGTIGPEEGDELRAFRDRLGLSDHQAAEIVRLLAHQRRAAHCPHCGQPLGSAPIAHDAAAGRQEAHPLASQLDPMTPDRANIRES